MAMLNSRTLILAGIAAVMAIVLVWKWVAGWGYVTINVKDAPLAKVIKDIEHQGGIRISTNADPKTPVTMNVEKVLPFEAVDTLAIAIDGDIRLAYVAAQTDRQIKDVLAAFSAGNNPGGWTVYSGGWGGGGGNRDGGNRQRAQSDGQGSQAAGQQQAANPQENRPPREQRTAQDGQPRQNREQRGGDGGGFGGGFAGGFGGGFGSDVDPRLIVWKPSASDDKGLQAYLSQGSQKTSALFAIPQDWNPAITKLPKEGLTGKVTVSLVKSAKGTVRELFLLTVQPPRPQTAQQGGEDSGRWEFTRTVFSPQRGGQRNPEWMAERANAQIAALPEDQRADAKKQMDEMRAFWESVRNLPEEERRQKIEDMMNRPDVQDRMEERMNARDAKTPVQKREDRMRRYLDRKAQMKGAPAKS